METLDQFFYTTGRTIYKSRNEIKVYDDPFKEGEINVKRFRVPIFINKWVYTFLRDSKAKRAYQNTLLLQHLGVETPNVIGTLHCYEKGLLQ